MKKSLVYTIAIAMLTSGCSKPTADQTVTELRYQGSTGIVTLPELAEDLGYLGDLKLKYVGNVFGGPQDLQTLATNDVDFATAFNGAIVKLHASGIKTQSVIGSYGSDDQLSIGFFVLQDSPIQTARDLIGKTIAVNTLGAHAEFAIKDYLTKNGLTQQETKQVELTVIPPVNTEQVLRAGQVDVGQLQSSLEEKALERGGVRRLFRDIDLYGHFTAGSYVFTEKFIAQHPAVVRQFVSGTAKAIEWSKQTPREEVRARLTQIIEKRGRNENSSLVPYWRSYGVAEKGGVITAQQYQPWIDWLVKDGQLKPNQIDVNQLFTNQFNPYATDAVATVGESP